MSVLEVWNVKYLKSGEEKNKSFNWFDFEGLHGEKSVDGGISHE